MDRTSGLGFVVDASGHNMFVDQDLVAGVDGTDVEQVWLNGLQEEVQALQAIDGHVPVAGDNGQMKAALLAAFVASYQPNGYQRILGGLIIQWFNVIVPGDATRRSYPLPTTFPNAALSVTTSYQAQVPPYSGSIGADFYDTGHVGLTNSAPGGSNRVNIIAVGY